jgi:hypothetical protein
MDDAVKPRQYHFLFFFVRTSPPTCSPGSAVTHGWVSAPRLGLAVGQLSLVSLPVGHASPVVSSSPELVGGLVLCFGLSGVLGLF